MNDNLLLAHTVINIICSLNIIAATLVTHKGASVCTRRSAQKH